MSSRELPARPSLQQYRKQAKGRYSSVFWDSCRRAYRTLRRSPGFTVSVIAILSITTATVAGLGTAAYELLNGSLPYGSPDRLMLIWGGRPKSGYPRGPLAGQEVLDLRQRSSTLSDVAGVFPGTMPLEDQDDPARMTRATVVGVTRNFFELLRVTPHLGRTFELADESFDTQIVLSWNAWQHRFGGDPQIVGRKVRTGDATVEIIGVMPASFRMVFPPDTTVPSHPDAYYLVQESTLQGVRTPQNLRVVARLRPDATTAAAAQEVSAIGAALEREFTVYASTGRTLSAVGLNEDLAQHVWRPAVSWLFIVALLVLVVYVNLAALWIARATVQARDIGIQLALGASAARLRVQQLAQMILLTAAGVALGLIGGAWGLRLLAIFRPPSLARIDEARLTAFGVVAVAAVIAVSTLLLRSSSTPLPRASA